MTKRIKYPVGIQTFQEIRKEDYLYVDKTALIYALQEENKYVFLSRPRRFGKSLLMSTLESYFKGRKELFEGLAISYLEKDWHTYPVFRFDLSGNNFCDTQSLVEHINYYLDNIEADYSLTSSGDISTRFKQLIRRAYERYGRKVVILIDEYDKPMLDNLHDMELHDKLRGELRGFYSSIKSSDEYIRFAMLTGITKFGKVSIFSGLNMLDDISMLPSYNEICGISETEFRRDFPESIRQFAGTNGIPEEEVWQEFKSMYDGYHFAKRGEYVYNPYSVLKALKFNEIKGYWYETGSSDYLVRLFERHSYRLDGLSGARRTESQLGNITNYEVDIVPFLYQAGYLTLKSYDSDTEEYTLDFPNREVNKAFWESLADHYFRGSNGGLAFDQRKFVRDLAEGRPNDFMIRMQSLFADTSSEPERNKEIHFQNMMAIAGKMLGLTVGTEVHFSAGRCDMVIRIGMYVYIFEFKIDGSAEEALKQIHDRGYHLSYGADGRRVYLIGANFSTTTRTLTPDWIIEEVN